MIFTVIIALEFKRTLLLVTEQTDSVVQVRAVILIALLAIVRKLIILDISPGDAPQLVGTRGSDALAWRGLLARQGSGKTGAGLVAPAKQQARAIVCGAGRTQEATRET